MGHIDKSLGLWRLQELKDLKFLRDYKVTNRRPRINYHPEALILAKGSPAIPQT